MGKLLKLRRSGHFKPILTKPKDCLVWLCWLFCLAWSDVHGQVHNDEKMIDTKYGLQVILKAQPNKGEALADIMIRASKVVMEEKGCLLYLVSVNQESPDEVWITEVWSNKDDHDASLNLPEVRALIGEAIPVLAGPPQKGQELQVLGGI